MASKQPRPLRTERLSSVFSLPRMRAAWKKTVRDGLRRQPLPDLHDYLDTHRGIDEILPRMRADILRGAYRPAEPEVVTIEKKLGVLRRVLIPAAQDALVLQVAVDVLEQGVRRAQASSNAYYSRSHDGPAVDEFEGSFAYPWWVLWPKFQREVFRFLKVSKFVVSTDIANYFDNIPLAKLRNAVASTGRFDETAIDFLFFVLDAFVWRPEYIPMSGVGLPQLNFDAPRLLAHLYLYPYDRLLVKECPDRFVRWMDDVTCGVDSAHQGRLLLGKIDTELSKYGIRLNSGKSNILTAKEAHAHFWVRENLRLSKWIAAIKKPMSTKDSSRMRRSARIAFTRFVREKRLGHWEKALKRYLTLFSYLRDDVAQGLVPMWLRDNAGLRESIYRYYMRLGPSQTRARHVREFLRSGYCVDDASFLLMARLLTEWPLSRPSARFMPTFIRGLRAKSITSPGRFQGVLWLCTKYCTIDDFGKFVVGTKSLWSKSAWAARQVAACVGLLNSKRKRLVHHILASAGLLEGLSVFSSITLILDDATLDYQLRSYLKHPPAKGFPYLSPPTKLSASTTGITEDQMIHFDHRLAVAR